MMVLFGFIAFVSVAALLLVQRMNIEREPRPTRPSRAPAARQQGFPAETMALRRI